jgi:hypothetical protein
VTLGADYLDRRADSGDPALQRAYALTIYDSESKAFDCAFCLLDAGASREEFVVAVSPAREETRAYGVASIDSPTPSSARGGGRSPTSCTSSVPPPSARRRSTRRLRSLCASGSPGRKWAS